MTPEQYRRVGELYHAAMELAPEARVDFLAGACGDDDELRREVESLLRARQQADGFIAGKVAGVMAGLAAQPQNPSLVGRSLGHYQVLSLIGVGGMGEVFLAEDTRLGRKVALKALPSAFTGNPDRVRRFEQEAKAASALNQPNILTIHEIGEIDDCHFIVSEYVEGETLRQRMKDGKMACSAALDVAIQVASALSAAHAAGITHRDIKPENVMVRPDRLVKVLDFGLAKLTERPAATPEVDSQAETLARLSTEPGVVMGTASYMSPEQARGQKVDARTDIFSLGVMLYEMIAGRRPFEGTTMSDVMAAILTTEPAKLSQHSPEVPPELERIVAKAMRKDREERYQVAKDLLVDLKDLKQELEIEAKLARADRGEADAVAHTTSSAEYLLNEIKQHKRGVILTLTTLIVVGAGIAYWLFQLIGQQKPATLFQAMEIRRLTHMGRATPHTAISPDGKYLVYVMEEADHQSLWLRHVATNSDTQIVAPAKVVYRGTTFSPDGNFIYYVRGKPEGGWLDITSALYKATILGRDEKKLIEKVTASVTFSPDGNRLAFVRRYPSQAKSALIVANVDGTGEKELATRETIDGFARGGPSWSPDGKIIACNVTNYTPVNHWSVVGVRVADGVETPLTSHRWCYLKDRMAVNGSIRWQ